MKIRKAIYWFIAEIFYRIPYVFSEYVSGPITRYRYERAEEKRIRARFKIPKDIDIPVEYTFGHGAENMFYEQYKNNLEEQPCLRQNQK